MKKILVTGGCGFIGSSFVTQQILQGNFVVNVDKMTYAANAANVLEVANNKNYHFVKGDICDQSLIYNLLQQFEIDWLVNFAAESHVDNSIANADVFIQTNINGTFSLLQACRQYYDELVNAKKTDFRFLHVSTDEVFGSLKEDEMPFAEESAYRPNSPYSASKAASDHLVRAWRETYKLPTIITNCSNNYGPKQHPEKLIPTIIRSALGGKDIPIYGNGKNIRDWIFVEDHCRGIELAISKGRAGETYCFGGECEMRNIDIAEKICEILDEIQPRKDGVSYKKQIKFVEDRKGHDYRYAINNSKVRKEFNFIPQENFSLGITKVIQNFIVK
jgi:dTDP-glucose 4,6-dehydratase